MEYDYGNFVNFDTEAETDEENIRNWELSQTAARSPRNRRKFLKEVQAEKKEEK